MNLVSFSDRMTGHIIELKVNSIIYFSAVSLFILFPNPEQKQLVWDEKYLKTGFNAKPMSVDIFLS